MELVDLETTSILLRDMSTGKNIIWATDNYITNGAGYSFFDEIKEDLIIKNGTSIVVPRNNKSKQEQTSRIRDKAEVFTPSWMCNRQNNLIDQAFFGSRDVFNDETENGWKTKKTKIDFGNRKWEEYVFLNRLEISCGEAPYLTSRYDAVSGKYIKPIDRIGLLDRKLRVICENADSKDVWIQYAVIAVKSIYGYDWQGDNVFIARQNILLTVEEFYYYKFSDVIDSKTKKQLSEIIAWNIWQMDGIKCVVPESCHDEITMSTFSLFSDEEEQVIRKCKGCETGDNKKHNGVYCQIMDWEKNKPLRYVDMVKEV